MKVWISDAESTVVTCLALTDDGTGTCEVVCLEGFFVSKVESEKIDQLREQKVQRFQEELERIDEES